MFLNKMFILRFFCESSLEYLLSASNGLQLVLKMLPAHWPTFGEVGRTLVIFSVAEMAEQFHRVTVLQTHFCDWQWALEQRESLYAHQAQVEALAKRMVLRRAFTHWKHCILFSHPALSSASAKTM